MWVSAMMISAPWTRSSATAFRAASSRVSKVVAGQAFETTFTSSFAIPKIPTLTPETVFTIVPGSFPSIGHASSPS